MSASVVREGRSIAPTVTTAGTEGSTDEVRTFLDANGRQTYARPCFLSYHGGTDILYVRINGNDANPASATVHDFAIGPPSAEHPPRTIDLTAGGRINVSTVSLFLSGSTADFTADVIVRGFSPQNP